MNDHQIDGVVALVAKKDIPEIVRCVNRLTIDGNQGVPRLHAGLLCTTVHHDASDVDVILFGDDL